MANNESTSKLILDGDPNGLVAAMHKAQSAVKDGADGIGASSGSITKSLAGAALGFASFASAAAVMGMAVRGYIENEEAIAQLEARLKSTNGVAGQTSEGLQEMASNLQKMTTFADDATIAAQALLLTFTNVRGPVFQEAIVAIQDMSIALKQDLQSSTIQVGKALNDPIKGITALSRVGVSFTEAQKETIKTLVESGNVMDAQKVILQELQVEFGGSATAARDTLGGALTSLNNAFGDTLEATVGAVNSNGGMVKAIHLLTLGFEGLGQAIQDANKDHDNFVASIERIGSVQAVNYLTLFLAAKAAATGDYAMIPTILKAGYESGKMSRGAGEEVDPQMARIEYDRKAAARAAAEGKRGGGPAATKDKSLPDMDGHLQAFYKEQQDLKKIYGEMERDALQNSESYLNYVGKMSENQQKNFDETAMLSEWAARRAESRQTELMAEAQFYAEKDSIYGDNQSRRLSRIDQEEAHYIQSWAMMTDSFEVEEQRRFAIEEYYGKKREGIARTEAQKKLGYAQSGFSSMSSIADSFYQLSGKRSKAAFKTYQIMKSGEIVVTTADTAMKSYNAMSSIPYVGPALGAAAAIAAGLAGAVQLGNLWSVDGESAATSVGSSGTSSGGSGGGGPSAPVTQPVGGSSTTPAGGKVINLHIYGNVVDHDKFARELIPSLQLALADGVHNG